MPHRSEMRRRVCQLLIAERELVGQIFGFAVCPAPTWDILLDLYSAQCDGTDIYLSSLCIAAHIPLSSAHRKVQELVDEGWLQRFSDASDGRRVTVRLSGTIMERMTALLDTMVHLIDAI